MITNYPLNSKTAYQNNSDNSANIDKGYQHSSN